MSRIRLFLDEDTRLLLAQALRDAGYDAVHINEIRMKGTPDPKVLRYGAADRRAVFTHNAKHYLALAAEYARSATPHWGIVVTQQAPFGEIRVRLLRFLGERTAEEIRDTSLWLP